MRFKRLCAKEITERGTHKELEELKGTYFKLMELQRKALSLRGVME